MYINTLRLAIFSDIDIQMEEKAGKTAQILK